MPKKTIVKAYGYEKSRFIMYVVPAIGRIGTKAIKWFSG